MDNTESEVSVRLNAIDMTLHEMQLLLNTGNQLIIWSNGKVAAETAQNQEDVTFRNILSSTMMDDCKSLECNETIKNHFVDKENAASSAIPRSIFSKSDSKDDTTSNTLSEGFDEVSMDSSNSEKPHESKLKEVLATKNNQQLSKPKRMHTCQICDKNFRNTSDLVNHLRVHTGERPFECQVCNERFKQSSTLKRHMGRHTDQKRYICQVCDMKFRLKYNLSNHMLRHTNKRPFACKICDKKLRSNYSLKRHMQRHTKEN